MASILERPSYFTSLPRDYYLSDVRFEREVDPERALSPEERQKRAKAAKSAYFSRLSLKSLQARRVQ